MVSNNYLRRNFKRDRSPDKISAEKRSFLMSKIRSENTKFELNFISKLRTKTRKKFATHVKELIGKPDIVFFRYKVCVFLDSDFWHGWQYPRWKHLLKNDFWREKIQANRVRDKKNTLKLRREGWTVIRIWQHSIDRDIDESIGRILKVLNEKSKTIFPQKDD